MNLSRFENAVVHLADTKVVGYILERSKSRSDKKAANALKLFLNEAVKSGQVVKFIRDHDLEESSHE